MYPLSSKLYVFILKHATYKNYKMRNNNTKNKAIQAVYRQTYCF